MIGSDRGWAVAPYVACPAGLPELAAALTWMGDDIAIVPGLSLLTESRADVMRGEEVQVFGALALGAVLPDATICHPGTHTKWITLTGGRIERFRTIMSGELFALLKGHSVLAALLDAPVAPNAAFRQGMGRGHASGALAAELFGVRAAVLLGTLPREDAAAYASGIVIGCDLRIGLAEAGPGPVAVVGGPTLTGLYATALATVRREAGVTDGAAAFVAGMRAIVETMR